MHDRSNSVAVTSQPSEQVGWMNYIVQLSRGDVPPLLARPEKIANNDAFPGLRQIDDDVRPYEPNASGDEDQIVTRQILKRRHDPF
jgi:hypothetical protein